MSDVLILNEKIKRLAIKGLLDIKYADEIIRRVNYSATSSRASNPSAECKTNFGIFFYSCLTG